jgi:hypothetical protein
MNTSGGKMWARQRVGADATHNAAGDGTRSASRGRRRGRDEEQIQAALVLHLTVRAVAGLVWWHTPNGGNRSVAEAGRFKALGVKAGVPDVLALHAGRLFALELKAERGRVSEAQEAMLADLEAAGATVAVAFSLDDALATLMRWGLIKGARVAGGPSGAVPRSAAAAG